MKKIWIWIIITRNMKKKIKKTGEIIDVIGYSSGTKPSKLDIVNYIGENGIEVSANLNYYLDLEDVIIEFPDYWQKLKHEAAVSALAGITASNTILGTDEKVDLAIKMADNLICKLKNENCHDY